MVYVAYEGCWGVVLVVCFFLGGGKGGFCCFEGGREGGGAWMDERTMKEEEVMYMPAEYLQERMRGRRSRHGYIT